MILTGVTIGIAALLIILLIVYKRRFWGHPKEHYSPAVAWNRAGIFFCSCFLLSWATGTMSRLLNSPVATPQQLGNPAWIAWTAGCFIIVFTAYWIIWARMTITFDRKRYLVPQMFFGIVWGLSVGQIFVMLWELSGTVGLPMWGRWIVTFMLMSLQGIWQDLYWDVYVVPEHDTPFSLKWKIICSHIPNMLVCLTYLALYGNALIFVLLQTLALTGAAVAMRMPPFWVTDYIHPPRTEPGLFGLPHSAGYIGEGGRRGNE